MGHLDECVADDLAFPLGVLNALELVEKGVARVDDGQVDTQVLVEHLVDLLRLVLPQHAVVDHNGVEAALAMSATVTAVLKVRTGRQWPRA
jgi:hypothetical protein